MYFCRLNGQIQYLLASVVVVLGSVDVVVGCFWHVLDSSPRAANMNLFWVMTAALLDTPATPVGVPVAGCGLSDRKQYYYLWPAA